MGGVKKIFGKAEKIIEEKGLAINEYIDALPKSKKSLIKPLVDAVQKWKGEFIVDGVIAEPQAIKVADAMLDTVKQFGSKVSDGTLIRLRRVWDKQIALRKGKEGFTDEITSFGLEIKREATNAIRGILSKGNPKLAVLNKEFSFWKDVEKITSETLKRTAGQSGRIREKAGEVAGAVIGGASGGISGAAIGAYAGKLLTKIFNAGAYKTRAAVLKNRIADAIISGDTNALFLIAKEIGVIIENTTDKD